MCRTQSCHWLPTAFVRLREARILRTSHEFIRIMEHTVLNIYLMGPHIILTCSLVLISTKMKTTILPLYYHACSPRPSSATPAQNLVDLRSLKIVLQNACSSQGCTSSQCQVRYYATRVWRLRVVKPLVECGNKPLCFPKTAIHRSIHKDT